MPPTLSPNALDRFAAEKPQEILDAAIEILRAETPELWLAAGEYIWLAVSIYQRMSWHGEERWSDVHRDLASIAEKARDLHSALSNSKYATAQELLVRGSLWEALSTENSEYSSFWGQGFPEAPLLLWLERLRETAENLSVTLPRDPRGRGGGIPESDHHRRELVRRCHNLFEALRPSQASSTVGGDFRALVTYVWELATGESEVDLARPVEFVLREPIHDGVRRVEDYDGFTYHIISVIPEKEPD